jgi:hypothetical protein
MMQAHSKWLFAALAAAAIGLSGTAVAETPTATHAEWRGMIEKMSHGMDSNKDGMVSRKEFLDEMGKRFDRIDKSKKGMVDMKSIEAILSDLAMRPGPGL